jgi:hypothetical protein
MSVAATGLAFLRYSKSTTTLPKIFGTALGIWAADQAATSAQLFYHGAQTMKTVPSPITVHQVRYPLIPWTTYTVNDGVKTFRTFNLPWVTSTKNQRWTASYAFDNDTVHWDSLSLKMTEDDVSM